MLDPIFAVGLLTGLLVALLIIYPCLPLYRQRVRLQTLDDIDRRVRWYRYLELKRKLAAGDPEVAWLSRLDRDEEHTPPA